jgi:hypothetical protein
MKVELVVNPRTDAAFAGHVARLAARGFEEPTDRERALRQKYPATKVIRAEVDYVIAPRWYVYREGR